MAENTALARIEESARQSITDTTALTVRIREWQEMAHVLTPVVQVSALAPQHAVNIAVVLIDSRIDDQGIGAETYGLKKDGRGLPWLKADERAIGKTGLLKISAAAGISWDAALSGRTDDRKERYYWEYKAVGSYVGFDGRPQTILGTFELDLRDGSPALKGFTPAQIDATRKSGLRICESKAINAAVRELGIKQKYTVKELEKPFVILRTAFIPDMKDPMQRQLVAERALGGASALYGHTRRLEAGPVHPDIDVEPANGNGQAAHVETSAGTVDAKTGELVDEKTTAAAEPTEPTGPTITDVQVQEGKTRDQVDAKGQVVKKGGRPFTRYFVTLSDGEKLHTFDAEIGKLAQALMKEKVPVEVQVQEGRFGKDIVELTRASAHLPFDDDAPTDADLKL